MSRKVCTMPPIAAHALWAPTYDRDPNPLLSLEEQIVELLLPAADGLMVLDVACGTGRWLENLVRRGAGSAVGIDLSSEMLRQASHKPALATRLIEADCLAMPVRSASADFAIASFCLGYVAEVRNFARELARVVRQRGQVVISDFHPSAHARGWTRSFRHDDTVIEISSFHRPLSRIIRDFESEGFELRVCLEPRFGEADKPLFEQCGRADLFSKVVGHAALFVCLFIGGRKVELRKGCGFEVDVKDSGVVTRTPLLS